MVQSGKDNENDRQCTFRHGARIAFVIASEEEECCQTNKLDVKPNEYVLDGFGEE